MTETHLTRIVGHWQSPSAGTAHALVHENIDNVEVLHAFGSLDLSNAGELEATLYALARQPRNPIVVMDFTACNYLDSTILTVLVRASRELKQRFAVVVPPQNQIRRLFLIAGLEEYLALDDNLADVGDRFDCELPAV